jgi:5-methylcytosine-specific restriction endonuclease McrA
MSKDTLRPDCKICKTKLSVEWQKANREKVNLKSRIWNKANPEKRKVTVAAWKKANPDKVRADRRKRRALKAGNIHEDWTEQELFETYGTDCYLCNLPIDFDAPKRGEGSKLSSWPDHQTPTSKGGSNTLENVRPCHRKCNESKGNKTYEEYMLTRNSQEIVTIK